MENQAAPEPYHVKTTKIVMVLTVCLLLVASFFVIRSLPSPQKDAEFIKKLADDASATKSFCKAHEEEAKQKPKLLANWHFFESQFFLLRTRDRETKELESKTI